MEKIKSLLSGHKSEDATHDAQTSSTGAHHDGQTHPIYDQMASPSSTQPTTSTSAGQTTTSTGLGQTSGTSTGLDQTEHRGTEAPLAGHSAATSTGPGPGRMHEGMSEASIKSGVIGFGAGERQGHAALSQHTNPEADLDRNQIVGGGNAPGPTTADTSNQPSVLQSINPLAGNTASEQPHSTVGSTLGPKGTTQSSTSRQPFDQTLRQESYTNDTDRSFPLAGGVAPKHDTSARHPTEHTSTTQHPTEHHTSSTIPAAQQTSTTHYPVTSEREPGTKEREVGVHEGHGRDGLAGAAAAATGLGVAAPLAQSHQRDVHDQGLETRDASYGAQPTTTSGTLPTSTTTTTTTTTSHSTQSHHPEALAAATAAAANSSTISPSTRGQGVGAHDSSMAGTSSVPGAVSAARAAEAGSHNDTYTDPGRPPGGRSLSYRHVPGGFPTPTPDESKTYLFYRDEVVPDPSAEGPVMHHVPSTRGTPWGEHQLGRDTDSNRHATPIAGGLAAGGLAGGLAGSQAAHHGDTTHAGSSTAGPHKSDALNKLDPRIDSDRDGSKTVGGAPATERGIDQSTSVPISGSETSAIPSGQHELRHTGSLEQPQPRSGDADEHHYGRDAAIAGGVGAGAAGLGYAATHDRDTPNAAGSNLPHESSPYSSKQLDPRALGSQAKLEEQRFDPQTQHAPREHGLLSSAPAGASSTTHQPHDDTARTEKSTTGPHKSSLLNKLDPRVKNDKSETTPATTKDNDPEHHYGRDAALVGGGAATAAGVHHGLNRNDTPGTGTAVLPEDQSSRTTGPLSSTTAPHQSTSTTAPLSGTSSHAPGDASHSSPLSSTDMSHHPAATKKYEPYTGPKTTEGSPFYGTAGAPAPVVGSHSSASHVPDSTSSTSAPITHGQEPHASSTLPATQHQDPQHHYGRDAGLAGAGLATAGGLAYAGQHDDRTNTGPASNTLGPHSSNAANVLDPRVQPDPSQQVHHNVGPTSEDPASRTIGQHQSNIANILDPRVQPDPSKQKAHTTTGPHQSDTLNRLDPKVDEKAGQQSQHHLGRDAAIVGGTGAAGYGAYEAANAHGDHRSTQPGASMTEQRPGNTGTVIEPHTGLPMNVGKYGDGHGGTDGNPTIHGLHQHGVGTGVASSTAYSAGDAPDYEPSATGSHASNPVPTAGHYDHNNDHTGRNVALGSGAALGAGGLYAVHQHGENTHQAPLSSTQPLSSSAQPLASSAQTAPLTQSYPTQSTTATAYPAQGTIAPTNTATTHAPYGATQDPYEKDHTKRDAALLGGAGAAAVGGAAYAHNQESDIERERARLEKEQAERLKHDQKVHDKEQHQLDKEHAKQEKEVHKHEKEQHKHEKAAIAAEKQEHKHEKEQEKEAHRLEKEREKEAARLEKEREKAPTPEKKHGILGFLHRDKSKKEKSSADNSPRQSGEVRRSVDNSRHSREYAAGGAALGAGTTAAAYDDNHPDSPRWKANNKLHKDPPKGHPAREALEHHEMGEMHGGKREHIGTDGPIGDPNAISGLHETRHNTYGAEPLSSAHGNAGKVIEPHTGLPMNVGKYGDGHGGTDGNPTIHGLHHDGTGVAPGTAYSAGAAPGVGHESGLAHNTAVEHGAGVGHETTVGHGAGVAPGQHTTDWEAIKKADTPY